MIEQSGERDEWPVRPWLMAAVGALGGLVVWMLSHDLRMGEGASEATLWRFAGTAGVLVATLSFIVTAERRRIGWAAGFALGWGLVVALVAHGQGAWSRGGDAMVVPLLSAILAVLLAAPLFQTMRDSGRREFPYERVHSYLWTDGIAGAASLAFTGLSFLLFALMAFLFDAIGVSVLRRLLDHGSFGWAFAGAAFGAANGVLRGGDHWLATLQRLVASVLSLLAPIFAGAVLTFLLALPLTGFAGLWKAGLPETPMLLGAAAASLLLLNTLVGATRAERREGRLWHATMIALLVVVLPLAALALVSMGMRVGQYGWTPGRLWGVVACAVALAWGALCWAAWLRRRGDFDEALRGDQVRLALGTSALALFLALPIVDFGAIATRSQLARLEEGRVSAEDFDWAALAFDFGPAGRRALERLAGSGGPETAPRARAALMAPDAYGLRRQQQERADFAAIGRNLRLVGDDVRLTEGLRYALAMRGLCDARVRCALVRVDADTIGVLTFVTEGERPASLTLLDEPPESAPVGSGSKGPPAVAVPSDAALAPPIARHVDAARARIEIREVRRRQLYVDGQPVGEPLPLAGE